MLVFTRPKQALRALTLLGGILVDAPALAESPSTTESPAPPEAIELTVASGYRTIGTRSDVFAAGGIAAGVGIASRISRASLGLTGEYAELDARSNVRSANVDVAATYHVRPNAGLDPWIGAGIGYRYVRHDDVSAHGIELLRVMLGADVRGSQILAAGPTLGFELDVFPWTPPGVGSPPSSRWYAVAFIGIQGRFDVSPACFGD